MPKKSSEAEVAAALVKNAGIMAFAARDLGLDRWTVQQRIKRSPKLQKVLADIEETTMDAVEGVIVKAIQKGDEKTARWYAERKGKARGYGNATTLKLGDEELAAVVAAAAKDPDALRKLAEEG